MTFEDEEQELTRQLDAGEISLNDFRRELYILRCAYLEKEETK